MFISKGTKELAKQIVEHPEEWVQGEYEFIHKRHSDVRIWTANGTSFIKFKGNEAFNFFEKLYLNDAIKCSIASRLKNC